LEALNEREAHSLDDATLDAIDRAEDQIERGQVHDWKDVREQVRARFLGK
jgi:flavin-binding protein dodecin